MTRRLPILPKSNLTMAEKLTFIDIIVQNCILCSQFNTLFASMRSSKTIRKNFLNLLLTSFPQQCPSVHCAAESPEARWTGIISLFSFPLLGESTILKSVHSTCTCAENSFTSQYSFHKWNFAFLLMISKKFKLYYPLTWAITVLSLEIKDLQ